MPVFKKDGYMVILEKKDDESYERLTKRGYFIVSQKPKTQEEIDEYIRMSELYVLYLEGNEFSVETMNKIEKLMKNI
jgi:hypothetical protein